MELAIYAVVPAVLTSRLLYYRELAEKTNAQYVATVLRSALREKMAELVIHNREIAIPALAAQNPVQWLERSPPSYCGETDGGPGPEVRAGCRHFDKNGKTMTHLVNSGAHFKPDSGGRERIRYRLAVLSSGPGAPG